MQPPRQADNDSQRKGLCQPVIAAGRVPAGLRVDTNNRVHPDAARPAREALRTCLLGFRT